jgi:hypothetical protein
MMTYLSNFIATGNPNSDNLPQWQEWSNSEDGAKVVLLDANDERALVEMSHEEVFARDVRIELGNQIAQWPLRKRLRYGIIPYMLPLAYMQLQPEQIVLDLGIHGELAWNTGYLLRLMVFSAMANGQINTRLP